MKYLLFLSNAVLAFQAYLLMTLPDQYEEFGKMDLAGDMIDACLDTADGRQPCQLAYAFEDTHYTIRVGGNEVYCRARVEDYTC